MYGAYAIRIVMKLQPIPVRDTTVANLLKVHTYSHTRAT